MELPEGLEVDDEDMCCTSTKNVGAIDLDDMKEGREGKKNKKLVDLSTEFGFNNAAALPMTAAEREAKREADLKQALENDPSLAIETDKLQVLLNYMMNAVLAAFTLGVMYYVASGTNTAEGGD
jgi:hypothetical protein